MDAVAGYVVMWCLGANDAGEARFRTIAEAERYIHKRGLLDYHLLEQRWSAIVPGFYYVDVT